MSPDAGELILSEPRRRRCKHEIYNDHFQNYRRYGLPKARRHPYSHNNVEIKA